MRVRPAIVGFALSCGLGAAREGAIGRRSLAFPAGFALAVAMEESGAPEHRCQVPGGLQVDGRPYAA